MDDAPSDLSFSFARFADGFDNHIRKSIRGYNELLEDCIAFSEYFIDNDTSMFDIGCSTGSFLMHLGEKLQASAASTLRRYRCRGQLRRPVAGLRRRRN